MPSSTNEPSRWMLYGATGYTGRLLAEEAVRRGHRPVLAGRSRAKLMHLAERLGLDMVVVGVEDAWGLMAALRGVRLVLNAAGPFVRTSTPMLRACLDSGVHYLDITGELPVFANTFRHDAEARARGVVLMSGVGFDVVPSDCMARYVADKVPGAHTLELASTLTTQVSAGTAKSALAILPGETYVRRAGLLWPRTFGQDARRVCFPDRERIVVPAPLGDLVTAWYSTGIPNITTYVSIPGGAVGLGLLLAVIPMLRWAMSVDTIRDQTAQSIDRLASSPNTRRPTGERTFIWARACTPDGRQAEACLETIEPYVFTAITGVRTVEGILSGDFRGALTPAQAFGPDFVLSIAGSRRMTRG